MLGQALQGVLGVGFRLGWREDLEWTGGLSSIPTDGERGRTEMLAGES